MIGFTRSLLAAALTLAAAVASQQLTGSRDTLDESLRWRDVPELNGRLEVALAYDEKRDRIVLFGGFGGAGYSVASEQGETWEWDGSTWRRRATTGPPPRHSAAMAYCPVREKVILFGGTVGVGANTLLGDMWEWDGEDWHELHPLKRPPARYLAAIASDPVRQRVVMFGGVAGAGLWGTEANDTWEWDGADWHRHFPSQAPTPRAWAGMAFVPNSGRITLFGGGVVGNVNNETWEWTGAQWNRVAVSGPAPSARALPGGLATEPISGGALMLAEAAPDTWLWSGTAWLQVGPTQAPMKHRRLSVGPGNRVWSASFIGCCEGETWSWTGIDWSLANRAGTFNTIKSVYDPVRDQQVSVIPSNENQMVTVLRTEAGDRRVATNRSPPFRDRFSLTYHAGLQRVLLYGGGFFSSGQGFNDLWAWDGTSWTEIPTPGPRPPAIGATSVVHDAARDKLVALVLIPFNPGEHWEWDVASGWQKLPISLPQGAKLMDLAFDARRDKLVLVGYATTNHSKLDVWELEPPGWQLKPTAVGPPSGTVAYAPGLGGVVCIISEGASWVWSGGPQWTRLPDLTRAMTGRIYPAGIPTYDAGRRQLWVAGSHTYGPDSWILEARHLSATPYVRPGENLELDLAWPSEARSVALLAFARSQYPGVPLLEEKGLGPRRLPLAADDLLLASLSLGLTTRVDVNGRASWRLRIPTVPALAPLRFHAAVITFGPDGQIRDLSNAVDLEINR